MGTALVRIRVMPVSPQIDLETIKKEAHKRILEAEGKNISFKEEPVAFGLKAIIVGFGIDEATGDLDRIENLLKDIHEVNSVQVIDMRRDFL